MSSRLVIARKDFTDSIRTRSLQVICGLMTFLVVSAWWTSTSSAIVQRSDRPFTLAIAQFGIWLPLAAIGVGFKSIVGERTSGSIRLILGQPATRRDVVYGTYLGRSSVLVVAVLLPVVLLAGLVMADFGTIAITELLGGTIALLCYALAWIGMAVGVSALADGETRAVGLLIGVYAIVEPLWTTLVLPLCAFVVTGSRQLPEGLALSPLRWLEEPTWYLYANRLSPSRAFEAARHYVPDLVDGLLNGATVTGPHAPNLFGLAVLCLWASVPVVVGCRRFERAELR